MEIIKYEGTSKSFIGLFKECGNTNEENKLFVVYALTDGLNLNCEKEEFSIDSYNPRTKFILGKNYSLYIPILCNPKDGRGFTMIRITDESQYDLVKTVVESLV